MNIIPPLCINTFGCSSHFVANLGALRKWRLERGWDPNNPTRRIIAAEACEHIVVLNKRDLVPEWGTEVKFLLLRYRKASSKRIFSLLEPFRLAMANKFPHQRLLFASWQRPRDIRNLSEILVSMLYLFQFSADGRPC